MSMKINKSNGEAIITITDTSLMGISVDELKIEALKLIDDDVKKIVLDLAKTKYIDSSGIGKILFINKKLISNGGVMEITSITDTLLDFFEALAIDKIIKLKK